MSGELLFLSHRIPFPADRGDKIRSHHLLRAIAALGPVHVGTFGECDADMAGEGALAGRVELAGRATMLALALPLLTDLVTRLSAMMP